jgi:hypothetical protein
MTKEQLEALMDWARAMARYEIELERYGDPDGSYRRAEEKDKTTLYAAFGIES